MQRATSNKIGSLLLLGLLAAVGCAAAPVYGDGGTSTGTGGAGGSGNSPGTGGMRGGFGGATPVSPSGIPIPPKSSGSVAPPAGTPGNLKVLSWAGFKSALTYSFDDAQPSQIEHYADLQAMGVHLTFFITSNSSNGTAAWDATFAQAVRDGHEIGNHTVHHCKADLSDCTKYPPTSLDMELDGCTSYITGHFGQSAVWTAASPFGDTGYDAPAAARFFLNRGVQGGTIAPNDNTDPFNLPCHGAVENETVAAFNTQIDGAESAGRWLIMLIHTIKPTAALWYAPLDIGTITDSVFHAQTLGDVWIDSMMNIGAYWRAQKVLSTVTPTTTGANQTWTWTLPDHFPPGKYVRVTVDGGTLMQNGTALVWDPHGFYEVALDPGTLTLSP
jgi:hypothetical protein